MFNRILLSVVFVFAAHAQAGDLPNERLNPASIPKFVNILPRELPVYRPVVTTVNGTTIYKYTVTTRAMQQQVLPQVAPFVNKTTTVYAYGGDCISLISGKPLGFVWGWPGPTFIVPQSGIVEITWINEITGPHIFKT